tara:strand:- start:79 stop:1041 length:963 start_codon:yes stop_codon:yes gene_type:complete
MEDTATLFPNIVGQDAAKRQLEFYLQGYNATSVIPHIMFTAPRGCGKTLMAKGLARHLKNKETGRAKKFFEINCSTLKNVKQFFNQIVVPHLVNNDATILFDEASELPKDLTMALLTILNPNAENRTTFAYDDYNVDFDFRRLSFVFCTTEAQQVFHALMDRMERIDLEEYSYDDLGTIVRRALIDYNIDDKALERISKVLRGNARAAQKMAGKLKLYMDGFGQKKFGLDDWKQLRHTLGILPLGLSKIELQVLRILLEKKECSLTHLAAKTSLTKGCLQRDYELYLQKMNLMEISTAGRKITKKGKDYLDRLDKALKEC